MKTIKSLNLSSRKPKLELLAIEKLLTGPGPAAPRPYVCPGETYRQNLERRATAPLALEIPWSRGGLNE